MYSNWRGVAYTLTKKLGFYGILVFAVLAVVVVVTVKKSKLILDWLSDDMDE